MKIKNGKHIVSTKPNFLYFLLILVFPLVFFLSDDSPEILNSLWNIDHETPFKVLWLFFCFGIPIILYLTRKEITLFENVLVIRQPGIGKTKRYQMSELNKWEFIDVYIYKAGRHQALYLWFNDKRKISFERIEANKFKKLLEFVEINHLHKKRERTTLYSRLIRWYKKRKGSSNI